MRLSLIAILLACAVHTASAAQADPQPQPQVVVSGSGHAVLPPDRATVRLAMESRAGTAAAAGSQNADRIRAIREAIEALGIASDSITTSGYSVQPFYESESSERVQGYAATNVLLVRTRRLEQAGEIIDTALRAGANRIEGVQFNATRSSEARRAALAEAVRSARTEAEALAEAAGLQLGGIIEMTTQGGSTGYMLSGESIRLRGASSNTSVNAADVQLSATVTIRYALQGSGPVAATH